MYPTTAQMVHRVVVRPIQLPGGEVLQRGVKVVGDIYAMNHDPTFWDNPDVFLPERHLQESILPLGFISFGYGKRNCLGMRLAFTTIKTVTYLELRHHRLQLPPDVNLQLPPYFNLHPQNLFLSLESLL